jgi:putative acetyltransferase
MFQLTAQRTAQDVNTNGVNHADGANHANTNTDTLDTPRHPGSESFGKHVSRTPRRPDYRDGPPLRVREARPGDGAAVCEVHRESVRQLGPNAYDDEQVAAWDHDREPTDYPLDEDGVTFVVAERLDRVGDDSPPTSVVGFAEVRPHGGDYFERAPDSYGEVRAVYVHPDVAREGVGSRLLGRLERTARRAGVPGLTLHASLNAVGFYERRGYERLKELEHEFGETGVTGTVVEMTKRL